MFTLTIYTWALWLDASGDQQAKRIVAHKVCGIHESMAQQIVAAYKENNKDKEQNFEYVLTSRKYL